MWQFISYMFLITAEINAVQKTYNAEKTLADIIHDSVVNQTYRVAFSERQDWKYAASGFLYVCPAYSC